MKWDVSFSTKGREFTQDPGWSAQVECWIPRLVKNCWDVSWIRSVGLWMEGARFLLSSGCLVNVTPLRLCKGPRLLLLFRPESRRLMPWFPSGGDSDSFFLEIVRPEKPPLRWIRSLINEGAMLSASTAASASVAPTSPE